MFQSYDRCGDLDVLEPVDTFAPALLDASVPGPIVIQMFFATEGPFARLRSHIQHLLDATATRELSFEDLDLEAAESPW